MKLHILVASARLLWPAPWPEEALASIVARPAASPVSRWIGPADGERYHDYLLSGRDNRLKVFAEALSEDFGRRTEPIITFARLAEAPGECAAALAAIAHGSRAEAVICHVVTLGAEVDPEAILGAPPDPGVIETLRRALDGVPMTTAHVALSPGRRAYHPALGNALATHIALAPPPEATPGLTVCDPQTVAEAVRARLTAVFDAGLAPRIPLDAQGVATLGAALLGSIAGGRIATS